MVKVLIIDDDASICRGLKKLIPWQALGFEVVGVAYNGKDGIRLVSELQPEIIISDIKMPLVDGIELSRYVNDNHTNTTVILLSAHDDFEYARQAMAYGVKHYILKPLNREKIDNLIDTLESIKEANAYRQTLYLSELNNDLKEEIEAVFKSGESEQLQAVITREFAKKSGGNDYIQLLCIRFVQALYDSLYHIGLDRLQLERSRDSIINELLALTKPNLMKDMIYQMYDDVMQFGNAETPTDKWAFIDMAKDYIKENYSDIDLSVSMIADHLDLSLNYLSNSFRKVAGINMTVYITDVRFKEAKRLLRDTNLKISSISERVGFSDSRYFSKVFKRYTGMRPSEFRSFYAHFVGGEAGHVQEHED